MPTVTCQPTRRHLPNSSTNGPKLRRVFPHICLYVSACPHVSISSIFSLMQFSAQQHFSFPVLSGRFFFFKFVVRRQAKITKPKIMRAFLLPVRHTMSRCPPEKRNTHHSSPFIPDLACHLAFRLNVMCHLRLPSVTTLVLFILHLKPGTAR